MRLDVKGVNFGYTKKVQILHDVAFTANSGQLVSLIGPNGSGKTTMVKCINQILQPQSGTVLLNDTSVHSMRPMELAKKVGYVPQMTKNFMGGTVLDAVLMGRRPYIKWKITEDDVALVLDILEKMEISHLAQSEYESLSGGQKQKVLIARALAQDPEVYLFDEPTSFLDIKNQLEIMEMAQEMVQKRNKLVIMVVHDLNMAMRYSDQIVLLNKGAIVSIGSPKQVLNQNNILNVYGVNVKILEECYIAPVSTVL